jgi:hypothetical protein
MISKQESHPPGMEETFLMGLEIHVLSDDSRHLYIR